MKKNTLNYKPFPGLKIYCKKCKYEIHNTGKGGLKTNCPHPIEQQIYKAVLTDPNTGKRKTRIFETRVYDEAVAELLRFKEELKSPVHMPVLKTNKSKTPMKLIDCMAMYLDYLNGVNVRVYEKRKRDKCYLDNQRRYCEYFLDFLETQNINPGKIKVDEVTESIVEAYYLHVKSKTESPHTFNSTFKPLKGLYNFLRNKRDYKIENPFKNILQEATAGNPQSFELDDVFAIIDAISPDGSKMTYPSGEKKNMYLPWLADAVLLALYTGVRREQLLEMKWNDIICSDEGKPISIKSNNLKVNRMKGRLGSNLEKFVFIPISDELFQLLIKLGFNELRNSNGYLIAPNEKASRRHLMERMSRSFTFYSIKAGIKSELSFMHLRKTYISTMAGIVGPGGIRFISGHSSDTILANHYIDSSSMAKNITEKGFRFLG